MEGIYVNDEHFKPSTNQTGPRSLARRFHGCVVPCLGLLCGALLAVLIWLSVAYYVSSAELSSMSIRLQASNEQRDQLNASLSEMCLPKTCPAGWMMFSCSCYYFSKGTASWEKGREDCRRRRADLTIISSLKEQEYLSKRVKHYTWIGLRDVNGKSTWEWIDGTPLTLRYWEKGQPDKGGGEYGEAAGCAHIIPGVNAEESWNNVGCNSWSLPWICERMA